MRVLSIACLGTLLAGVLLAASIVGVSRALPSSQPHERSTAADPAVASRAPAIDGTPSSTEPEPRAIREPIDPRTPVHILDLRPLDANLLDRDGRPPKRRITHDELMRVAAAYDIVADDLRAQPDGIELSLSEMTEMRAINPRIRIVRILGVLALGDPASGQIAPDDGSHSSWFLRDGTGEVVEAPGALSIAHGRPAFALDPGNADLRTALAARVHQYRLLGYDGVLLEDVCLSVPNDALASRPRNPATHGDYIDAEWRAAMLGLLVAIRAAGPESYMFVHGDRASPDDEAALVANGIDAVVRDIATSLPAE